MTWRSAHDLLRTEFVPPSIPYTDAPARWECRSGCAERFFSSEIRDEHEAEHRQRPRKPFPHGKDAGYQRGCTCLACRVAHNEYNFRRKQQRAARQAVYELRPTGLLGKQRKVRVG